MSQSLDLSSLQKAMDSLASAIDRTEREKSDDMLRDSVIQRFEYTYELCWKMLKRRLKLDAPSPEAIDEMSFREMIRKGAERGLIDDPSDIDLAIIADAPIDSGRLSELKEAFSESDLPYRVDVVDYASASPAFRDIIAQEYEVVQKPGKTHCS
ncbi:MAG: nucleotidyltransferase substrate binding protein [Mariprofundaceae bacterium]|nr:nucleotidyltransferase substrate binding protein [Mariprofundaceae bacterium]